MPQIQGKPLHTMQYNALDFGHTIPTWEYRPSDSGQTIAHHAISCPGFRTDFSDLGILCPRFRAYNSDLGISCPRFRADHCTPCIIMPQVQGRLFRSWNGMSQFSGRPMQGRNDFILKQIASNHRQNQCFSVLFMQNPHFSANFFVYLHQNNR